jgi:hypothetical protein
MVYDFTTVVNGNGYVFLTIRYTYPKLCCTVLIMETHTYPVFTMGHKGVLH